MTEKKSVVLVFAVDIENNVILKSEYRYPILENLVELPGGTIENTDINFLERAKQELLEETGYYSEYWEYINSYFEYPTKDEYKVYIFMANRAMKKDVELENNVFEDTKTILIPIDNLKNFAINNVKVTGSLTAIFLCLDRLSR